MRRQRFKTACAMVLALFVMAPTVGDIGGCGGTNDRLDARKFFAARYRLECDRCRECGWTTRACLRACDRRTVVPSTFPNGCEPVVHDGEVCLNALEALDCAGFGEVVDPAPIVPTECDFCPVPEEQPAP
jgi:hypothetical protein